MYLEREKRPSWLRVEQVLGNMGLKETPAGRRGYGRSIRKREFEMMARAEPWQADKVWGRSRRGWCVGEEPFRGKLAAGWRNAREAAGVIQRGNCAPA